MATKFEETQLLRASLPNDKTWRPINKVNIEVSEGQAVIIYGRCHMNPQFSHAGEMFFSSEVHVMDGTKKLAEPVQGSGFDMYNSQKSKDCVFGVWKATVTGTVQLRYMARAGSSISGGKVLLTENKCTLGAVVI